MVNLILLAAYVVVVILVGRVMYLHGYRQGRSMRRLHDLGTPGNATLTRGEKRRQRRALRIAEQEGHSKQS